MLFSDQNFALLAALSSRAMVILLFHCIFLLPFFVRSFCVCSLFCNAVFRVLSSLAIISLRERERERVRERERERDRERERELLALL